MNNRLFAILIVVCLAGAGGGCASEAQKHKQEVLLPRQTGSNLNRRITVDDESSFKKTKPPKSRRPSKKSVKTEREPKRTEPEKPEETAAPPDRFR